MGANMRQLWGRGGGGGCRKQEEAQIHQRDTPYMPACLAYSNFLKYLCTSTVIFPYLSSRMKSREGGDDDDQREVMMRDTNTQMHCRVARAYRGINLTHAL